MKSKYLSFIELIFTVVAICGIFFIQGCSKSEIKNPDDHSSQSLALQTGEFRFYNEKYKMPKGLAIWEAQLNKAIEMDSNMVRDGLKMIRYEYIRQIASIKDLESVKTELKNDNSLFIVYKDNFSHFSISENKEYAANYSNLIDSLLPTSESILEAIRSKGDTSLLAKAAYIFEKNDIGVVNLVWEYKGKTLNTLCLVSNKKGIVYDKFLFFICTTVSKITSVPSNSSKALRLYIPDGPVRENFHVDKSGYDVFGWTLFICWVDANLIGERHDGVNFAIEPNANKHSEVVLWPWTCASLIGQISFHPGPSPDGHLEIVWGTSYKFGGTVTVGWGGSGVQFSGGGTEDGGIVYLKADEMY